MSTKQFLPVLAVFIAILGSYFLGLQALADETKNESRQNDLQIVGQAVLLPVSAPPIGDVAKTMTVILTGYSSTEDQTDSTPFTTASNKQVRDGIIANNFLSFGTKVRIPEVFGDKVFEVDDRMNRRKGNDHFDVWFSTTEEAIHFGAQTAMIEVLAD